MAKQKTALQLVTEEAVQLEKKIDQIKSQLAQGLANAEFMAGKKPADMDEIKRLATSNRELFDSFFDLAIAALEINTRAVTIQVMERKQYDPNDTTVYPGTYAAMTSKPPEDPEIVYKHLVGMNTSSKFH